MNMITRLLTTMLIGAGVMILLAFLIVGIVRLTRVLVQFVCESLGYDANDFYFWVKRHLPKRKETK